jgi:hypothetical protein
MREVKVQLAGAVGRQMSHRVAAGRRHAHERRAAGREDDRIVLEPGAAGILIPGASRQVADDDGCAPGRSDAPQSARPAEPDRPAVGARDDHRLLERECAVYQALFEGGAFHEFQDESGDAVVLGDAVDSGNVRVTESRKDVRLALEARTPVGVARDRVRQELESHVALQLQVSGAIHLAHPARSERCQNLI